MFEAKKYDEITFDQYFQGELKWQDEVRSKHCIVRLVIFLRLLSGVFKNHPFFRKPQKPFLPFKIKNIR